MNTGHSIATARHRFSGTGNTRAFRNNTSSLVSSSDQEENNNQYTTQNTAAFGPVPSTLEVQNAIYQLQRFMDGLQSRTLQQVPGYVRLRDAFSMMQQEPAFQNMVISISCDNSVWQAIQSNEVVQDLQRAAPPVGAKRQLGSSEEPDITELILRWIIGFAKLKIVELVEKFGMLLNEMLHPTTPKKKPSSERTDQFEEKIRSSMLLSVIILMIVVVARTRG